MLDCLLTAFFSEIRWRRDTSVWPDISQVVFCVCPFTDQAVFPSRLVNYMYTVPMFAGFCVVVDKDKEGDNAVVGPVPLMQDAANQDIRE